MIHWAFLILAFVAGLATGWITLYYLVRLAMRVEGAIESACKTATPWG